MTNPVPPIGLSLSARHTSAGPPEPPGYTTKLLDTAVAGLDVYAIRYTEKDGSPHETLGPGELVGFDRFFQLDKALAVGYEPRAVAVHPAARRAYVVNYGALSYSVSTVDLDAWTVIKEHKVNQGPFDVAVDTVRDRVYVTNGFQRKVQVFDVDGDLLEDIPAGTEISAIAVDETTGVLYVISGRQPGNPVRFAAILMRINPFTHEVTQVTVAPEFGGPQDVAVDPASNRIYVTLVGSHTIGIHPALVVIDLPTMGVLATVNTPSGTAKVAVNPGSNLAYVTSYTGVQAYDPVSGTILDTLELPGRAFGITCRQDDHMYVTDGAGPNLYQVNPAVTVHRPPYAAAGAPTAMIERDGKRDLFVIGADRAMWHTIWQRDQGWSQWRSLGGSFPVRARIAAVATGPEQWYAGGVDDSSRLVVTSNIRETGAPKWLPAGVGLPLGAPVTAVSTKSDGWVFFTVDGAGDILSIGGDNHASNTVVIEGKDLFAPGAEVAAVSRRPGHWDLLVLGTDGVVQLGWFVEGKGIHTWQPIGDRTAFPSGTPLAIYARMPHHLDAFAVDADGQLRTAWWSADEDDWTGWGTTAGTGFAPGVTTIAVDGNEFVLATHTIAPDGQVWLGVWRKNTGWVSEPLGRDAGVPHAPLAVAESGHQLDAAWTGPAGEVLTIRWSPEREEWSAVRIVQPIPVVDPVREVWLRHGGETGRFGQPLGPAQNAADGTGVFQEFEGGTITGRADLGWFALVGDIRQRWLDLGREAWAYPTTDETGTGDGKGGRFNHFRTSTVDASIYWTPETGAVDIAGTIRDRWAANGWERSGQHYPVAPEEPRTDGPGTQQRFQRGRIVLEPRGAICDPAYFTADIPDLGGWGTEVAIYLDGSSEFRGGVHNENLFEGYDFHVNVVLMSPTGTGVSFYRKGHVGADNPGPGDGNKEEWDESHPVNNRLQAAILEMQDATIRVSSDHTHDITGVLDDIVSFVFRFAAGVFPSPVPGLSMSALIFIGVSAGSLITNGSLGPGAHISEGLLWLAGPEGTFYALAADLLHNLGEKSREIHDHEYEWLKRHEVTDSTGTRMVEVFGEFLPPKDKILITDTIGAGDRPFVFPTWDGKYSLNLGPDGEADPINFDPKGYDPTNPSSRPAGHSFVHETMHAWQLYHRDTPSAYPIETSISQIWATISGNDPYDYEPAGQNFSHYGPEAQAELFADWYTGHDRHNPAVWNGTRMASTDHDYYRYAVDNVQAGNAG